jgi:hypothetical protein
MNERIRGLAEQAAKMANIQNELYGTDYTQTFNKKFAELIVLECTDLVEDDDNAFDILKHFGVEE